ncbi:DUF460 domain-containing protein [Candidatus Altiarchaeota archaeon]
MPKYILVGVDPGTTMGLASLDFKGNIVELFSSRHLGLEGAIEHLVSLGHVSLVATDVFPVPRFVSKVASTLGATVFYPDKSMSVKMKNELTSDFKEDVGDVHQRDALAAALNAYSNFKNKFQKIGAQGLGDEVKNLVLQGISVDAAIAFLSEEEEVPPKKPKPIPIEREISEEERMLSSLKRHVKGLKEKIKRDDTEIKTLQDELAKVKNRYRVELRRDPEIREKEESIKNLESTLEKLKKKTNQIEHLQQLWTKAGSSEIYPVGVFPQVYNGLTLLKRRLKKRDWDNIKKVEIAFVDDPKDRDSLVRKGIKASESKALKQILECYYIPQKDLKKIRDKGLQRSLDEIVGDYRSEQNSKDSS